MVANSDRSNRPILRGVHPQKFALWLSLGSMTMLFAAFSSAYIVREAAGNWLEFRLPDAFFTSTVTLVISSVCLYFSLYFFRRSKFTEYRIGLILSLIGGLLFLFFQYTGWMNMFNRGIDLKGNPSGSFVYLISGVHALHIVGGIFVLILAIVQSWILPKRITEERVRRLEMTNTYWHFIDIVWVYLLLLFILV